MRTVTTSSAADTIAASIGRLIHSMLPASSRATRSCTQRSARTFTNLATSLRDPQSSCRREALKVG
eukprot:660306-Pleurochrysis_carterae.AAC.4